LKTKEEVLKKFTGVLKTEEEVLKTQKKSWKSLGDNNLRKIAYF